jgi:hypothetical protein
MLNAASSLMIPVADLIIEGHAHRLHPILQLVNEIFLIAALVGQQDDIGNIIHTVRDVERASDIVKQRLFASCHREALSQCDDGLHAVGRYMNSAMSSPFKRMFWEPRSRTICSFTFSRRLRSDVATSYLAGRSSRFHSCGGSASARWTRLAWHRFRR